MIVATPKHPFESLIRLTGMFCLCCMDSPKSLSAHSFDALIIPTVRNCVYNNRVCDVFISFCGVRGQLWYLIVWVPDICLLLYIAILGDSSFVKS